MNQDNNKTKILKKLEVPHMLLQLGLNALFDQHQAVETDEQLADFYHHMLTCTGISSLATSTAYAMIHFSTDADYSFPLLEEMMKGSDEYIVTNFKY